MLVEASIIAFVKTKASDLSGGLVAGLIKKHGMNWWKKIEGNEKAFDHLCQRAGVLDEDAKAAFGVAFGNWCNTSEFARLVNGLQTFNEDIVLQQAAENALKLILSEFKLNEPMPVSDMVSIYLLELCITFNIIDERYRENVHYLRHKEITDLQLKMAGCLEAMSANLALLANKDKKPFAPPAEEVDYHAIVDLAIKHSQRAKPREAYKILTQLREEVRTKVVSQKLLFRIATALSVALLQMEQHSEAKDEALTAVGIERSRLSFCNAANTHLLCGEYTAAFNYVQEALKEAPEDPFALAVYLQLLARSGRSSDLEQAKRDHPIVLANSGCLMILGQIAADNQFFSEAETLFREARKLDPYAAQLYQLEGQSIVIPIERNSQLINPVGGIQDTVTRDRLETVERLATECLKLLEQGDFSLDRNRSLLLRASALFGLGRFEGALVDCEAVLKDDPTNEYALYKAAGLQVLAYRNCAAAIGLYEQLTGPYAEKAQMGLCDCYIETGRYGDAEISHARMEKLHGCPTFILVGSRLKLTKVIGNSKFESVVSELLEKYATDADALFAISDFYRESGELKLALDVIKKAEVANPGVLTHHIQPRKARIYLELQCWNQAVKEYEHYVDTKTNNHDLYDYIIALSNSGQPGGAFVLAKAARKRNAGRGLKAITDIEAIYQETYGLLTEARESCISLVKEKLHTQETVNRLLRLNIRLGKPNGSID